jgi:type II secretory pathway pseudopilin PulG
MKKHIHAEAVASRSAVRTGREGSSLIELLTAVVIISIMAASIYVGGFAVLRQAQSVTIATAAHLYAKEGLEEMIAAGYDRLRGGEPVEQVIMANPETHHVDLVRMPSVIWHAPDGSTNSVPLANGYAEVIMRVSWQVPRTGHTGSTAISTLIF